MKKVITTVTLLILLVSEIILPYHALPNTTALYQKIKKITGYDNLVTNFYYIKCLTVSTYLLSRLDQHCYHFCPCNICEHNNCIQIDEAIFSHRIICNCIKKMIQTNSLQPFIILLEKAKKYHSTHNNRFFREIFILIFIIHKQILFKECEKDPHTIKKSTLETIMMINNIINQLPIAEILAAIDMLVTELPPFFEKYELNSKISWKKWFEKYWWVPPVFGIWFGLKILFKLQRPYFFYSPYYPSPLTPRPQIPLEPIVTNDPALLEIRNQQLK